jgi:ABC-2 type transport system ATP-binding protein
MSAALQANQLGRRYSRREALRDCTLTVPQGHVVGLVGPNGAGKTTLLQLAAGLIAPTSGTIEVLGQRPAANAEQLGRVGFLAQDAPLYPSLTVRDHLRLGAALNPRWDSALALAAVERLGLSPDQRARALSGGQRSQLALALVIGKQPDLLLLDEPMASLDPLARRQFMGSLMAFAADARTTIVLSSHLVADLERICDYLIVMVDSRVHLAGTVEEILASHYRLTSRRDDEPRPPLPYDLVHAVRSERQVAQVVRSSVPVTRADSQVESLSLEDITLAYLENGLGDAPAEVSPQLEGASR